MLLTRLCSRLHAALLRLDMAALRFRIREVESDIQWALLEPPASPLQIVVYRRELRRLQAELSDVEARHAALR